MPTKNIIFLIVGFIALVGFSIGGYFLFVEVEQVHKQNVKDLAGFGSKVVPRSFRDDSDSVTRGLSDGTIQLPPSIKEKKLSPTEKVILSLSRDKDELQIEIAELQEKLEQQTLRLNELRAYQAENERFAPTLLSQERLEAETLFKKHLDSLTDSSRFKAFQLQAITLATANLYTDVIRQHQLILDEKFKQDLIQNVLTFGLCFGDGLPFVTNSQAEEKTIVQVLKVNDIDALTGGLSQDFFRAYRPCLKQLNLDVKILLEDLNRRGVNPFISNSAALTTSAAIDSPNPDKQLAQVIDPNLPPTEQLIQSLSYDKEVLLNNADRLKQQFAKQAEELLTLKQYQGSTQRFAPLPLLEERNRTQKLIMEYLDETRDAHRFNDFEKQAMSYAAANHYAAFSTRQRLVLTETIKNLIIQTHLPSYCFCFGDGLKFIVESRQQERQLLNALREQDREYMDRSLAKQIDTITLPCNEQFDQQVRAFL